MRFLNEIFGRTPSERKKNLVRVIYVTVAAILLVTLVLSIALIVPSGKNDKKDDTSTRNEVASYTFSQTKSGTLLLVNKKSASYDFSTNPESNLVKMSESLPSANGSALYSLQKDGMLANEEALNALNEMIKDFYDQSSDKETAKKLSVRTAYRSFETQQALSSAVPAGHSDFHTGMLFELTIGDSTTTIKANKAFAWIYENAHKYGFIERYPESKASITGVSDFDNAFRYVGAPHASYIKEKGITLEEYVDLIKNSTEPLRISGYSVYYLKANADADTEISYSGRYFAISGDNNGGFIVTTK